MVVYKGLVETTACYKKKKSELQKDSSWICVLLSYIKIYNFCGQSK